MFPLSSDQTRLALVEPIELKEKILRKGPMCVRVKGFVVSGFAHKYYSYAFFGEILGHDGLKQEYVVGTCEQQKTEESVDHGTLHVVRFGDKKGLAAFYNQLGDYLRRK